MDGPETCERCRRSVGALSHIERAGWIRVDTWTSERVFGEARRFAFCSPQHLVAEMSQRRLG